MLISTIFDPVIPFENFFRRLKPLAPYVFPSKRLSQVISTCFLLILAYNANKDFDWLIAIFFVFSSVFLTIILAFWLNMAWFRKSRMWHYIWLIIMPPIAFISIFIGAWLGDMMGEWWPVINYFQL